jgi:hypothetical protein
MNVQEIKLYPNMKKTVNICKFKYQILEIKLKESVRVAVYLFNDDDILVDSKQYLIDGEEYANWGSDDNYIINLIKQKIQSGL